MTLTIPTRIPIDPKLIHFQIYPQKVNVKFLLIWAANLISVGVKGYLIWALFGRDLIMEWNENKCNRNVKYCLLIWDNYRMESDGKDFSLFGKATKMDGMRRY